MVLGQLGKKITTVFNKLNSHTTLDDKLIQEIMKEICQALIQADVNIHFIKKMRDNITNTLKNNSVITNVRRTVQIEVAKQLVSILTVEKKPFVPKKGKQNVVMFVGLQGSGKTTTCAKYANYYKKKGWRVALVCADTFRAGAFQQLKQNSTKIRVPFYGNQIETDPVLIASKGTAIFKKEGFQLIIIDTSGRHKQQADLFQEMKQIENVVKPDDVIFIMDSSIGQQCFDQAEAFRKSVNVGSVIITKLDGHAKGGGALSAVAATQSPINFIGTGQHFQQFESFQAGSFINRLLGMGDIHKLIDTVKSVVTPETQAEIMEKIKKGQFSKKQLRSQFQSILKLGSISSFMSLVPGMGNGLLNKDSQEQSVKRIKRYIYIMDSMTQDQMDSRTVLEPSRMRRIARGSGTSQFEINMLMEEYKRLKGMIDRVGPQNFSKINDLSNVQRNPVQFQKQMQKMLDERTMKQLGGMDSIMDMVKGMSKNPQFKKMQEAMHRAGKKK